MRRLQVFAVLLTLATVFLPLSTAASTVDVTGYHTFSNGLEARLFSRPSTSLVSTLVLVRAGYALEDDSNRGYSHLLEHLVFAGTEEVNKEELFREVEEMGGYLNGYTRGEYMGYLIVGHRDHFSRQMQLLSDILFQAALKEKALDEAREVVLEEIGRRESRPGTRAADTFQRLLYEGSSYAKTGLGNRKSLESVSREEITAYYRQAFRPDNMILLTAGGIDSGEALKVLKDTFGRPAAKGDTSPDAPPPAEIAARRVLTMESDSPDLTVRIGFNGPDPQSEDAAVLELLAALLGGEGGRLKAALEKGGFSPRSVGAGLSVYRRFSRFEISVSLPAGEDGEGALKAVLAEISAVASAGPDEAQIEGTRNALVAEELLGREKLHYYLMGKAPWLLVGGRGEGLSGERWDGVGLEKLRLAAGKYLADGPHVALLSAPSRGEAEGKGEEEKLRLRSTLDNGTVIVAEERSRSQVFALTVLTRRRSSAEPPGKTGIADFLHRMLVKGTGEKSKEEIAGEMRRLGMSLSTAGNPTVSFGDYYTSRSYSYLRLECLQETAAEALALTADLVGNASFPPEEVEKMGGQMRDYVLYRDASPGKLAGRLLAEGLYGPGAAGQDVLGLEETITSISREDLASFRDRYFTGRNLVVSVVSGLSPEEAVSLVSPFFAALPAGEEFPPPVPPATEGPAKEERELGKAQGALAMGAVIGPVAEKDRAALAVVAGILNDRLSRQLREKEGLAYSVGASFGIVGGTGIWKVSMGTSPEKIDQARKGIVREIESLRGDEITGTELARRVNSLTGRLQRSMLSSLNRAFYLALAARRELSHTYDEDYRRILLGLTPGDVEEAARTHLPRVLREVVIR